MHRKLVGLGCALLVLLGAAPALADNPASTTTSTGQSFNLSITGPDPTVSLPDSTTSIPVSALVSLGSVPASTQAHVSFVIDESGSLGLPNFNLENSGALALYNQLLATQGIQPYTSLIYFATDVQTDVNDEPATDDTGNYGESDFTYWIDHQKYAASSTSTKDAISAAITQLAGKSGVKQIILITDGLPNPPATQNPAPLAPTLAADGIQVYIYAVGPEGNCTELQAIATACTLVSDFNDLSSTVTGTTPAGISGAAISVDGGAFAPATLTGIGAISGTASGLVQGPNTIAVQATASDGTTVTADETVTVQPPPDTTIVSGPSGTVASSTASFLYSGSAPGLGFQCSLDGATFVACAPGGQTYSGLVDGPHTFQVAAVDALGDVDPTPATDVWTVDTTPPNTVIVTGPSGTVASSAATFTYAGSPISDTASFQCSLDGAPFTVCPPSGQTYAGLTDGPHTFQVRAIDAVGNTDQTPAVATWTVDTTPPDTVIVSGPSGVVTSTSATFTYVGRPISDTASFQCSLDGASFAACPAGGQTYAGLAGGPHTFQVRAIDAVGNTDQTPASDTWTVGIPTALAYTGATGGTYGTPITLSATLRQAGGGPIIGGELVTFTLGAESCAALSNPIGDASCPVVPLDAPSPTAYAVSVSFAGDGALLPASAGGTFLLARADPSISWPTPTSITYGTPLSGAQLDATVTGTGGQPLTGTLSYNPPAGTVPGAGVNQQLTAMFAPADAVDYTAAAANVSLTVTKAPLTVTADSQAVLFGAAVPPLTSTLQNFVAGQTPATSGVTGAAACSTSATAASPPGSYPITCTAGTLSAANYSFVMGAPGTLTISQAPQSIGFTSTPPANPAYAGSYTVQASGGNSGNPVTFTIDSASAPGACAVSGAKVSFTGVGLCVIDANQSGNADYLSAPQVQQKLTISTTVLPKGGLCNNVAVSGTVNGNLTVPAGASCVLAAGTLVTGNVSDLGMLTVQGATIDGNLQSQSSGPLVISAGSVIGGNLQTQGGAVTIAGPAVTIYGNVQVQGGGPLTISGNPLAGSSYGVFVGGNLQVQQLASSTTMNLVCATRVTGNLQWQNNGAPVTIGGVGCAGNWVGGNLQVQNNTLPAGAGTPAATVTLNTVRGNLQSQQNAPTAVVAANTVSGNTQRS